MCTRAFLEIQRLHVAAATLRVRHSFHRCFVHHFLQFHLGNFSAMILVCQCACHFTTWSLGHLFNATQPQRAGRKWTGPGCATTTTATTSPTPPATLQSSTGSRLGVRATSWRPTSCPSPHQTKTTSSQAWWVACLWRCFTVILSQWQTYSVCDQTFFKVLMDRSDLVIDFMHPWGMPSSCVVRFPITIISIWTYSKAI